jgi:kynurenine 3-monooxygenase
MSKTIHIVGSGLVGTLAAIIMARKGYSVELYERRADMRKGMADAGRSINLAVTARGFKALERVGLREHVLSIAIPMKGRMIHDPAGNLNLQPYGQKDDEVIYAASRSLLNMKLLDAADKENNIRIHFEKRCTDYDIATKTLTFTGGQGAESKVQADITIAADGAWSAVRKAMLGTVPNFNYSQSFLEYGYKELEIPAGPGGAFRMEKHALHIWPRNNYMLIALPNTDGSFTCTLFYPYEGQDSFARQKTEADVVAFFARDFADAVPMMPDLQKDFFGNPTGALVTVKCAPWHVGGQVLLLGDASHAIVPSSRRA